MQDVRTRLKSRVAALIKDSLKAGYVLQFDVGKPAAKRQALTTNSVYFRPLDSSDMYVCSCCFNLYAPTLRSRYLPNYVPLNWCQVCRLELVEAGGRADKILLKKSFDRAHDSELQSLADISKEKLVDTIAGWGNNYVLELQKILTRFGDTLKQLQQAEIAASASVDSDTIEAQNFRQQLSTRLGTYVQKP